MNTNTTVTPSGHLVTGLFPDRASAEAAYQTAETRGYTRNDVDLVMSDATRSTHFAHDGAVETELGTKAAEGAGIGGAIGGTIGAIAAAWAWSLPAHWPQPQPVPALVQPAAA